MNNIQPNVTHFIYYEKLMKSSHANTYKNNHNTELC